MKGYISSRGFDQITKITKLQNYKVLIRFFYERIFSSRGFDQITKITKLQRFK